MGKIWFLCFLLIVPALAVIGHDIYYAYTNEDLDGFVFQFSDLGWLWTTYLPDSYDWARANLSPSVWGGVMDPLLEQTSLVVSLIPAVFVYVLLFALKIFGLWPFSTGGGRVKKGKKGGTGFKEGPDKSSRVKYKRK